MAAVVVNRVLPELFNRREEALFDRLAPARTVAGRRWWRSRARAPLAVLDAASLATGCAAAGIEHVQRLRREAPEIPLLYLPFLFARPHGARARAPAGRRVWPTSSSEPSTARVDGATAPRQLDARLDQLLTASDVVIVCGAGGVGKTTAGRCAGRDRRGASSTPRCWC